jgi:proteasome lid subunit RPN8/RPN11
MMSLKVPRDLLQAIWSHGEVHYPEEGAGLLLGKDEGKARRVHKLQPLENQYDADSRHNRYRFSPQDMIDAEELADELGLEVIGVFHSHPDHPALPSEFDRERAFPWYSYLITSVQRGKAVESRSWRLNEDRQFIEEVVQEISKDKKVEVQ